MADQGARWYNLNEGIDYLADLDGSGGICGAKKGECSRVSCSYNAAVWLCNDSETDQDNVRCGAISETVVRLREKCHNGRRKMRKRRVLGYQEGSDGLSVRVGRDSC